jgi:hypothetical protein
MPLCSENILSDGLGVQFPALFHNFLEVLIPGAFFVRFLRFRCHLGAHWLSKWALVGHFWRPNSGELAGICWFGLKVGPKAPKGSLLGAF